MLFKKKNNDFRALIYMILLIILFSDENSMVKPALTPLESISGSRVFLYRCSRSCHMPQHNFSFSKPSNTRLFISIVVNIFYQFLLSFILYIYIQTRVQINEVSFKLVYDFLCSVIGYIQPSSHFQIIGCFQSIFQVLVHSRSPYQALGVRPNRDTFCIINK